MPRENESQELRQCYRCRRIFRGEPGEKYCDECSEEIGRGRVVRFPGRLSRRFKRSKNGKDGKGGKGGNNRRRSPAQGGWLGRISPIWKVYAAGLAGGLVGALIHQFTHLDIPLNLSLVFGLLGLYAGWHYLYR